MLKKENKKFESFIKKENKDNEIKYTDKDIFFSNLKIINSKLDFTRNAIFNVIVTNNYVSNIEFDYKNEIDEINDYINKLENSLENVIKKLKIKFDERRKN